MGIPFSHSREGACTCPPPGTWSGAPSPQCSFRSIPHSPPSWSFHPCFGYSGGGPQMPHESEEVTSAAKQGHTATGLHGRKDSIHTPCPYPPSWLSAFKRLKSSPAGGCDTPLPQGFPRGTDRPFRGCFCWLTPVVRRVLKIVLGKWAVLQHMIHWIPAMQGTRS